MSKNLALLQKNALENESSQTENGWSTVVSGNSRRSNNRNQAKTDDYRSTETTQGKFNRNNARQEAREPGSPQKWRSRSNDRGNVNNSTATKTVFRREHSSKHSETINPRPEGQKKRLKITKPTHQILIKQQHKKEEYSQKAVKKASENNRAVQTDDQLTIDLADFPSLDRFGNGAPLSLAGTRPTASSPAEDVQASKNSARPKQATAGTALPTKLAWNAQPPPPQAPSRVTQSSSQQQTKQEQDPEPRFNAKKSDKKSELKPTASEFQSRTKKSMTMPVVLSRMNASRLSDNIGTEKANEKSDNSDTNTAQNNHKRKNNTNGQQALAVSKEKKTQIKSPSKDKSGKPTISIADMFTAKPRTVEDSNLLIVGDRSASDDDAMQLFRLMQAGKVSSDGKGRGYRQRTRPRKKRFTALKKNVLRERLRKWRELHPDKVTSSGNTPHNQASVSSRTICILGFAEDDLVQDQDELEELVSNLKDMAKEVAPYEDVFIPTPEQLALALEDTPADENTTIKKDIEYPSFVRFIDGRGATAALSCWNGLNMGGIKLKVEHVVEHIEDKADKNEDNEDNMEEDNIAIWKRACVEWARRSRSDVANASVVLENVLTEDDMDDDDCLAESLKDFREIAEKYGTVADVQADRSKRSVIVFFEGGDSEAAKQAAEKMGKTIIGGSAIVARLQKESQSEHDICYILLNNALSSDDLEDEESLLESLCDLQELASKYGTVVSVDIAKEVSPSTVKIMFQGPPSVAQTAAAGFGGMIIGGEQIESICPEAETEAVSDGAAGGKLSSEDSKVGQCDTEAENASTQPKQMFSGTKLIGEKWAECKRAPKIPNAASPRAYASMADDEEVKGLIIQMLGELMRLQKRAVEEDKNTKGKRRLVMGLREVAKGIRTHKMKMVVMANNLDDYGAIDDKLTEILNLALKEDVPVFFELSKRGLGKAIGKSIKVAVVGILNAEGAYPEFKKLLKLHSRLEPVAEGTG